METCSLHVTSIPFFVCLCTSQFAKIGGKKSKKPSKANRQRIDFEKEHESDSESHRVLCVEVLLAKGLKDMQIMGTMDPFVELLLVSVPVVPCE